MRCQLDKAGRTETDTFFRLLPLPQDQYLEIRSIAPDTGTVRQAFCSSRDTAIEAVARWSGVANVYVGTCPRTRRKGSRRVVSTVPAAWADVDFCDIDSSDRDAALRTAMARVERFDHRPTILVHSGNGLQCWWLFDPPVRITESLPAERLEAINRGLAKALGGDAVHDIARVLRVPGTMNLPNAKKRARGCVPVMARLLYADGPTYAPETFRPFEVFEATQARTASKPQEATPPTQPSSEILDAFERLLADLGSGHGLARTWRGTRMLKDQSRSGYDMALMYHLVAARVRAEFIPTIVRAYEFGRAAHASDGYVARTLAKARAFWGSRHGTE